MRLIKVSYAEYSRTPREWNLHDFELGSINLVVGKNAAGKTRSLNLIASVSSLLAGMYPVVAVGSSLVQKLFEDGDWELEFESHGIVYAYSLVISNSLVAKERLVVGGSEVLSRGEDGTGKIKAEQVSDRPIDFKVPPSQLAVVTKRDEIQHPFLSPLIEWGANTLHLSFSRFFPEMLAAFDSTNIPMPLNLKANLNAPQLVVLAGQKYFPESFKSEVIADMDAVGFPLSGIELTAAPGPTQIQGPALGLSISETGLGAPLFQSSISQGMYRALVTLIHANYALRLAQPFCLLIDDIGEGLDYQRSTNLIDVLIRKFKDSQNQLIMATNDRYVMNKVPIEHWSVLQREGSVCRVFNKNNSRAIFEGFDITGLANFDFFSTEFYKKGFSNN
jgi:hypothetical protein